MVNGKGKLLLLWGLLLMVAMFPMGAQAAAPVVDDAGLFTAEEISQMETLIQSIQSTYQVDAVVVTSEDVPRNGSQAFADDYFDYNGYGLGSDKAGILYLIDMSNRVPHISTSGVMIDYMTDHRIEELLDLVDRYLQRQKFGASAIALLQQTAAYMKEGREYGSFRYDSETGERLTGLYNPLTLVEIGIAVAAGLVVCLLLVSAVTKKYTLKGTTYQYQANRNTSLSLQQSQDQFLRESRRTIRHSIPSSGGGGSSMGGRSGGGMGSSVHTSSSGSSHGGGTGRGF